MIILFIIQVLLPVISAILGIVLTYFLLRLIIAAIKKLIAGVKYALFSPKLNSVLTIIIQSTVTLFLTPAVLKYGGVPIVVIMYSLFALILADCIRDFKQAHQFYRSIKDDYGPLYCHMGPFFDPLFVKKSLLAFITFGLARIAFFLVVFPIIMFSERSQVKKEISMGLIWDREIAEGTFGKVRAYYFHKVIFNLEKKGDIFQDTEIADIEIQYASEKVDKYRPAPHWRKHTWYEEMFSFAYREKHRAEYDEYDRKRNRRDSALRRVEDAQKRNLLVPYFSVDCIRQLQILLPLAMSERGFCPLSEIKHFPELASLNLLTLSEGEKREVREQWVDYLIIRALQPLVASGLFEESDFNDEDVLDNHAYRYVDSKKEMVVHHAGSNPLLALDDDD